MDKAACNSTHASRPLTTFVQADSNTFRELVQRLTGPSEVADSENKHQLVVDNRNNEVAAQQMVGMKKRPPSKLHERRSQYKCSYKLEIEKPAGFQFKPDKSVFSPSNKSSKSDFTTSPLGTPSKSFSKLSILEDDDQEKKVVVLNKEEEEKAIKERRFYLHPSPRFKRGYSEPELLHLFPLTSPKN
ncbi:Vq motif-containing protein [Thalictrum thalictroides]|uniref:Vq motif-containing protein n=1 Tax=Thalictrum thalictroides TaxID=46969 RepID=A0A7J6WFJ7_THATH|nr:Vq motif-containing protein [Thalictrum thalictroides]